MIPDNAIIRLNWVSFHKHCLNCKKCKKILDKEIKEIWVHMAKTKDSIILIEE